MEQKLYRFFFHYYRQKNKMSVHFRGQCLIVKDVKCNVEVETKWSTIQPRLKLQGWCKNVEVKDDIATIT